jgi:hypothetical protein
MSRATWLFLLALAAACSSRDQSVGETRRPPDPIIVVDPQPSPTPDPNLNPDPDPNPNPNPDPDPDPTPSTPPCEDLSKHARTGVCVQIGSCRGSVLTGAGYECAGDALCCDDRVGCGTLGCPTGGGSGGTTSQAGEGGDASAGYGGIGG